MDSVGAPVTFRRSGTGTPEGMPTSGPLVDSYGRVHTDIRFSITDRCNLRCVYCLPDENVVFLPREEILSFEEIARVARVARSLGVVTARVTGGEPLIRKGVVGLVRQLADVGFDDLAMTTNGTGLQQLAQPLADAGLKRVNVSCDSLRERRYAEIRRRGHLGNVFQAMLAAESAGLSPLKINVVLVAGVNDDEILDFARHARETGRTVRFIEFMPLDATGLWSRGSVVSSETVLERINDAFPLVPLDPDRSGHEPADSFRFADGAPGGIGVIASVTRAFCGACNRLRLTADGAIRNCLFSDDETPVRDALRSGASDEHVAMVIRRCIWGKHPGHGINDPGFLKPVRSMSMIGG
ncbi:MAG: GTP 3',8-cyclase MoaA [Acidimicrobiales bacterium]